MFLTDGTGFADTLVRRKTVAGAIKYKRCMAGSIMLDIFNS